MDPLTHAVWIVRSAARFTYRMPGEALPLFERYDPVTGAVRAVGQAWLPEHGLLQDLANAGHLVVRGDTMFYAPFIRDELLALSMTGDTLWRFSRGFTNTTVQPRFELKDGRPVIDYHPINLGLAFGPTGTLFLLATADGSVVASRLDEIDPGTGRLLATADLPSATPTLAVAPNGRVHLLSAAALLATAPPRHLHVPDVSLPWLHDSTLQPLRALQGEPVILNFWASWCGPCRKELPALDSLRQVLARESIRVIGMNDDRDPQMARAFLAKVAPGFPSLAGEGTLQARFGYIGLPWTVLLDRQGQVVGQWVGELDGPALRRLAAAARSVATTAHPRTRPPHMPTISGGRDRPRERGWHAWVWTLAASTFNLDACTWPRHPGNSTRISCLLVMSPRDEGSNPSPS
ncbi:MAG: TlpA family protein disulfide reductase [Gemmatimonadetes bacterium]|nr:TlpA family protein disulfide reductase [Gemmatimonadota bacterium]